LSTGTAYAVLTFAGSCEFSPANAGLVCLLTSAIGSVPEDMGHHPTNGWRMSLGGSNETARIHHASRRRGRRLAARGARAAGAADHRVLKPDDGFG